MSDIFSVITAENVTSIVTSLCMYAYNISFLIIDVTFNALWSHPPNGDLLLTPSITLITTKIVPEIHIFCQPKVSYLDYSMLVNPTAEMNRGIASKTRLTLCTCANILV